MASYAYTFSSGDTVTPTRLNDARTVSNIVNADISATAAIADTKLATISTAGKVSNSATTATTATSASTIVLRDANANANLGGNIVGKGNTNEATNTVLGGGSPLQALTSGANNIAIGYNAQNRTTSGSRNVAVGQESLFNNTIGQENVAVGVLALNANITGIENTAVGDASLAANQSSSYNTAIGKLALNVHTTNNSNTAIGYRAAAFTTNGANTTCLGANAAVTASNQVQLGDSATTTFAYGAVQNRSDERDKTEIRDTALGLQFIQALRPVDFKWDMREDYRPAAPQAPSENASDEAKAEYEKAHTKWLEDVKLSNIVADGTHKRNRYHHGLIAQEVKAVLEQQGIDFGGFQDHSILGGDDVLSIGYNELIAPLIKSVQELSAKLNAATARIAVLESTPN